MEQPCPVCRERFDEKALPEHLEVIHAGSLEPEIAEVRANATHKCVQCGREFGTPEELSDHLLKAHKM
jgi:hypothetical protein